MYNLQENNSIGISLNDEQYVFVLFYVSFLPQNLTNKFLHFILLCFNNLFSLALLQLMMSKVKYAKTHTLLSLICSFRDRS